MVDRQNRRRNVLSTQNDSELMKHYALDHHAITAFKRMSHLATGSTSPPRWNKKVSVPSLQRVAISRFLNNSKARSPG